MFCEIRVREFKNQIENGYAKFKTFPGSDSREIFMLTLESGTYNSAVLYFGVKDLMQNRLVNQIQLV